MEKFTLLAENAVTMNNKIYCICKDFAVLFSINMDDGMIEIIGNLPKEKFFLKQSCRKIINYENRLIFVPYNAKYIHIYDIKNNNWTEIEYPDNESEGYKYIEGLVYNNKVIMIGACAKNIIELDMSSYEVKIINTYFGKYDKFIDLFCRSGFAIVDNYLYVALAVSNEVIKINLDSYAFDVVKVGNESYSGITFDGKTFWLTPRRGNNVVKWDGVGETEKINLPFSQEKDKCNYGGVYLANNKIYLHGFEGKFSAVIDENGICHVDKNTYIFFRDIENDDVIGQTRKGTIILYESGEKKFFDCNIDRKLLDEFILRLDDFSLFQNNDSFISETELYELKMYLGYLCNT